MRRGVVRECGRCRANKNRVADDPSQAHCASDWSPPRRLTRGADRLVNIGTRLPGRPVYTGHERMSRAPAQFLATPQAGGWAGPADTGAMTAGSATARGSTDRPSPARVAEAEEIQDSIASGHCAPTRSWHAPRCRGSAYPRSDRQLSTARSGTRPNSRVFAETSVALIAAAVAAITRSLEPIGAARSACPMRACSAAARAPQGATEIWARSASVCARVRPGSLELSAPKARLPRGVRQTGERSARRGACARAAAPRTRSSARPASASRSARSRRPGELRP